MGGQSIRLSVERASKGIRYRKMRRGKVWTSKVYPSDSRRNRAEATESYREWLEAQAEPETTAKQLGATLRASVERRQREAADLLTTLVAKRDEHETLETLAEEITATLTSLAGASSSEQSEALTKLLTRATALEGASREPHSTTALVEDYLTLYRAKAEAGESSVGIYSHNRIMLGKLLAWPNCPPTLDKLTEQTVADYYQHCLNTIANPTTRGKAFNAFRAFIDYCSQTYNTPLPRNLRSRRFSTKQSRREPTVWTTEEIKLFVANSTGQTRLYWLLMANCGFYQGDISDLTADEVDWDNGRIIRSRSKTQGIKVNWLLWDETFTLLKAHGNREGRVLTNIYGKSLVEVGIRDDGVETRRDCLQNAYTRTRERLIKSKKLAKGWRKPLKAIRKTGADLMEGSPHALYYELYLAHSSVAKRHYLVSGKAVPQFDEAIKWLGKQFGYETTR